MSQLQVTGEAKIRDLQGPVVSNSGVISALDGAASQYVRGDGTLADFPTSSGGGSSVSYYLNSSVSQGIIDGNTYRELSKEPVIGTGTDITISANGYVANYITDANDPALLEVPGGNFNCEMYFSVNIGNKSPYVYAELYKYSGSAFTLLGTSQSVPEYLSNGTTLSPYYFAIPVATASLTITDRLAIRIYVVVDTTTVTLHTENSHLCQVVTTFSKGLTSLNNLTKQVQFFATGTTGSDFNIVSSGSTHTFNIPNAGSGTRGLITSGSQTIAGAKSFGDLLTAANLNVSGVLTIFGNLSNGTYNYTLPVANGQLALTSQIPTISGTPNQVTRFNSSGSAIEGSSITDNGSAIGSPTGQTTINARLAVNNYTELNRYLSIIQNPDASWSLPSSGTSLEAFITSASGGTLITDTAYLRPRKASDDTYKKFIIQGDDLILNDAVRRTLINKVSPTQSTTKVEVAGYTRFDSNININSTLYFNASDASQPTYISESSGNLTALTTGSITLGTNGVNKFVFDANGALNLGTSDNSNIININNQFSTLNSTIQGVHITPSIVSATPVIYTGVKSFPQFFISGGLNFADIKHFSAINASNTNTTSSQIGLYIDNLTSNSIAYGIQSTLSSGSGKYNLYINGTAINYLKGRLGVDQTNPQYAVDVTGDVNVTGNFKINGTNLTQGISGSGSNNYIPKFLSSTVLGDSSIYQSPSTGHLLVNTTFDYSASGGYLQVAGGFSTESFANIIYGSNPSAGNTVTLRLVNGSTIQSTNDRTYFIENRINTGGTSANYYLNYHNGTTTLTRYYLDHTGLHTFNGEMTLTGLLTGADATFSGKIGIGTTTGISASMTVFSSTEANQIKVAGAAPATVFTDSLSTPTYVAAMGLCTATNNFIAGTTAGDFVFANQKDKAIIFGTGVTTTEKMRLTPLGYLLLGTTSSNGAMLQVNGSATFANQVKVAGGPDNGILVSGSSGSFSVPITGLSLSTAFNVGYITNYSAAGALADLYYTANNHRFEGATTFSSSVTAGDNITITAATGNSPLRFTSTTASSKTGYLYADASIIGITDTLNAGVALDGIFFNSTTKQTLLFNNGNISMTLTSLGNVGIGTTSPTSFSGYTTLTIDNTSGSFTEYRQGGVNTFRVGSNESNGGFLYTQGSTPIRFGTIDTERMRITSGGTLLLNTTSNAGVGTMEIDGQIYLKGNGAVVYFKSQTTANIYAWYGASSQIRLYNNSIGVIGYFNDSTGAYTATSDARMKDNIKDSSNALDIISKIKVRSYDWKSNGNYEPFGLIAQELNEVAPTYVSKPTDDKNDKWGVSKAELVPMLIKAIQEQQAQIQEQQAQIELLSNKIVALESK